MAPPATPPNIKAYIRELMLAVVRTDSDGRNVGHTYKDILDLVRKKFSVNVYPGPHLGKPPRMTVKQLREVVYYFQGTERQIRLPMRPQSDRKKRAGYVHSVRRKKRVTIN